MSHALVTIVAPLPPEKLDKALGLIRGLGNPAGDPVKAALDRLDGDAGVHFASFHALAPTDPASDTAHLVLEFSADGTEAAAIDRIADRIGAALTPIFALARDWKGEPIGRYLKAHRIVIGHGWFQLPGLAFAGTPGMSVGRIRKEAELGEYVTALAGSQPRGLSALQRLEQVRAALRETGRAWALETPEPPLRTPKGEGLALVAPIAWSFIKTYLWPIAILFGIVVGLGVVAGIQALCAIVAQHQPPLHELWSLAKAIWSGFIWLVGAILVFLVPLAIILGGIYLGLRRQEKTDWLDERAPDRAVLRSILECENHHAHNHMVSVTVRKPGFVRAVTIRLAFWIITQLARLSFRPGHLGEIGTIHFARWVTLPGTRDLIFFSNYGGSWESYLEDFITKAHNGLTAVWSNTTGFPVTENLFQKGATDGERFKRYARRSMVATPFWYSAYPTLTTANVRANAAIRRGVGAVMTDEEARGWLALFGSGARPAAKLESDQIQSLVFGGLGFMPYGEVLLVELEEHAPSVRGWLKEMLPKIAFDDGRRLKRPSVATLALGPDALDKAGLPADALESFPAAFLEGMTGPGRARILGDTPDDPEVPWWWKTQGSYAAAILVYGVSQKSVDTLSREIRRLTENYGHVVARSISLHRIPEKRPKRVEPFGFVDGTSQPVIRGTYRGLRNADPIHLVEPGEFILGYPDNRGSIPPGPQMRALDDPENRLPIQNGAADIGSATVEAPREIGRNGSFLVIRQLEQDYKAFWGYCESQAKELKDRLGAPYKIDAEFIGAKIIGRWKDGSSLVRNPYQSFSDSGELERRETRRPHAQPGVDDGIPAAPAALPSTETAKPKTVSEPAEAVDAKKAEAEAKREAARRRAEDNDFLYGTEDPEGLRCPFGAHIRRANPRDSLDPGVQHQIDISNRHRILRVGRTYVAEKGQKDGLMFMCLNADIERQFEFVQQTWLGSETFHGLSCERDPLAGDKAGCPKGFTVPTRDGPIRLAGMSRFVTPRGGGYFFLPGKRLLEFLSD